MFRDGAIIRAIYERAVGKAHDVFKSEFTKVAQ